MVNFKVNSKIVAWKLLDAKETLPENPLGDNYERPSELFGKTYKIKPAEHAYYITINDMLINGVRRPVEIFINSKDTAHRQWIDTLTRVISAVFRKGGEYEFLIEELKAISDPNGGHWRKVGGKGKFMPSIAADIGWIIQEHTTVPSVKSEKSTTLGTKCPKCGDMSVVIKDGCPTCLSCGDSKCG